MVRRSQPTSSDGPTCPRKEKPSIERRLLRFAEQAEACPDGSPTAETVAFTARSAADQLTWQAELRRPNPAIGTVSTMLVFLGRFPLVSTDDGDRYLEKLAGLPRYLSDLGDRLVVGAAEGRTPIRTHVEEAVEQLDGYLRSSTRRRSDSRSGRSHGASTSSCRRVATSDGGRRARRRATGDGRYRDVAGSVDDAGCAPRHRTRTGAPSRRTGALYDRLLHANTSLYAERGPGPRHRSGAGTDESRRSSLPSAGPLLGTPRSRRSSACLREDPALHYTNAEQLVADARAALERAQREAPRWFGTTPKAPCVAQEITAGALAFYSPPSDDGSQPGTFFFNVGDPSAWGTFQLQAIAYHEGVPGHHFQVARALETEGLHPVHTKIFLPAYGEGWGLYTERLADEMGLYLTDWDRVGMLTTDVDASLPPRGRHRNARHGVESERGHRLPALPHPAWRPRWSNREVDRYIGMPGQATSYMIGRLEIDDIRAEAERIGRGRFDMAGFHDVVLGHGSVPLPTLRRRVRGLGGRIEP